MHTAAKAFRPCDNFVSYFNIIPMVLNKFSDGNGMLEKVARVFCLRTFPVVFVSDVGYFFAWIISTVI